MRVDVHPGKVTRIFAGAVLLLTAGHLAGQISRLFLGHDYLMGLVPLLDFDREHNLPSYYSALALAFSALLLMIIARSQSAPGGEDARYWWGLTFLFAYLSVDEAVGIHEKMILPLQDATGASGLLFYAWVIPYGLCILILGIILLRFLLRLPSLTRRHFLLAAVVYLSGALVLELFGGRHYEAYKGTADLTYTLLTTAEEFLEMAGVVIFIHALLGFMATRQGGVVLHFPTVSDPVDTKSAPATETSKILPAG